MKSNNPSQEVGKTIKAKPGSWDCSFRYPGLFYLAALRTLMETGRRSRLLAMQLHRPVGEVHEEVQALVAACWKEKSCEELWQLAAELEDVLQIWIFNSLRVLKNALEGL